MTRSRNSLNGPPDTQTVPCQPNCPPDVDCRKVAIDLHQVTRGPEYQLNANITKPDSTDISSVILVVANNNSVLSRANYQEWPLDESYNKTKETTNLLKTLTKDNELNLKCKGCTLSNDACSCSLDAISYENIFLIFVLLQSKARETVVGLCDSLTNILKIRL